MSISSEILMGQFLYRLKNLARYLAKSVGGGGVAGWGGGNIIKHNRLFFSKSHFLYYSIFSPTSKKRKEKGLEILCDNDCSTKDDDNECNNLCIHLQERVRIVVVDQSVGVS